MPKQTETITQEQLSTVVELLRDKAMEIEGVIADWEKFDISSHEGYGLPSTRAALEGIDALVKSCKKIVPKV